MARSTVSLILTALLLSSCTNGIIQHQFHTIDGNEGWKHTDTLVYDIPEIQETRNYGLQIQARTGTRFPYRAMWIAYKMELEIPNAIICDTVRIDMSNNGKYLDASGVTLFSINGEVKPIHLTKGQKGKLKLIHLMSQETLPHIHDIGIKLM
ncbi:MAG: hypothetical protein IKM92_06050 [Bacteroidaceae bacterium]|jgi:gliding motility-associated lipoprotein GldH|nr:hypothetical protein [Bacteroidaceae bacterium]MBQ2073456.1 hypothetical protein [Bacteroidaceae bacterium]MBR0182742.1 hypothetical protein [Bacteroidaceae bacterium]MBR6846152.1 hypothetical protein [Bacteroidaceae bacterium]